MMIETKQASDLVKSQLGQGKFNELAALILERRIEEKPPHLVVEEILDKFGKDLDVKHLEKIVIFIKY
jgi:hypothetical protein